MATKGMVKEDTDQERVLRDLISNRLRAPFLAEELDVRPGNWENGGYKPLFYIDARLVIQRLNAVLGFGGYSVRTEHLELGEDTLRKKTKDDVQEFSGLFVTASVSITVHNGVMNCSVSDVGEEAPEPIDSGNKATSAHSQALKRAAVSLGVGAYLYGIDAPSASVTRGKFDKIPTLSDTQVNTALDKAGFKRICEDTGSEISWQEAAYSVKHFGRVLSTEAMKALKK